MSHPDANLTANPEGHRMPPADTPAQTVQLVADLLARCGHPDIAAVTVMATGAARISHPDGSANYIKVAHVQAATAAPPEKPGWPGQPAPAAAGRAGR